MTTESIPKNVGPVDPARCNDCPPERVCAWDCEQGRGVLEIMMGEALAEQARIETRESIGPEAEPIERMLYEIYT